METPEKPGTPEPVDAPVPAGEPASPGPILDLNFVPDWAKQPPAQVDFYVSRGGKSREFRDDDRKPRDRQGYGRRPDDRRGPRPDRGRREDRRDRGRGADRHDARPPREDRRPARPEPVKRVPVQVRFVPEQTRLSAVVRKIQTTRQAYPLVELASLFLSRPETCEVRLELEGRDAPSLHQCTLCRVAATDRAILAAHVVKAHLGDFFVVEETLADPPAGQFTCVARCGMSGVLLGPPNHHSYAEKLRETHDTRYPDMSLESYKSRIQVIHDPAMIEQWKEESRKQTVYRRKQEGGEPGAPVKRAEAEAALAREVVPTAIQAVRRAVMPATVAREIEDRSLMLSVQEAWQKENRFPATLLMALRGAFHHRHLHLFKAGRGIDFVSMIAPAPMDPEHAVDTIRQVLVHLREHPGRIRKDLVEALLPGQALETPEVRNILTTLAWLIERGHIIEFFNGTLAVPMGGRRPATPQPAPGGVLPASSAPPVEPSPPPPATT